MSPSTLTKYSPNFFLICAVNVYQNFLMSCCSSFIKSGAIWENQPQPFYIKFQQRISFIGKQTQLPKLCLKNLQLFFFSVASTTKEYSTLVSTLTLYTNSKLFAQF